MKDTNLSVTCNSYRYWYPVLISRRFFTVYGENVLLLIGGPTTGKSPPSSMWTSCQRPVGGWSYSSMAPTNRLASTFETGQVFGSRHRYDYNLCFGDQRKLELCSSLAPIKHSKSPVTWVEQTGGFLRLNFFKNLGHLPVPAHMLLW
jgi:hypothetical protein